MACLSEGAYLLVEMFGNIRKGKKMKFAGAPGEPLSLAVPLLHFFFFLTTSSFPIWSFSLLTLVLASDLYLLAAPRTWRWAGCSERVGKAERPPPSEPEPGALLGRPSRVQKSGSSGTEAGVQIESVLVPGPVDQRQVISPLRVPVCSSVKWGQ